MKDHETKLLEIVDIQVGYQARGRVEENPNGEFRIVRAQDFDAAGRIDYETIMPFSPAENIDPGNYLVSAGDILVLARGQSHLAFLIEAPLENTVAANTFYILHITAPEEVLPRYLTWWLNQHKVQAYFEQTRGVSTIPFITKAALAEAPVLLPPLKIQEQIQDLIALWGREQALLRELAHKKDTLIHAAARQAAAQSIEEH